MTTALLWFRRDLRVTDNPALLEALASAEHVVPVYIHATPFGNVTLIQDTIAVAILDFAPRKLDRIGDVISITVYDHRRIREPGVTEPCRGSCVLPVNQQERRPLSTEAI